MDWMKIKLKEYRNATDLDSPRFSVRLPEMKSGKGPGAVCETLLSCLKGDSDLLAELDSNLMY